MTCKIAIHAVSKTDGNQLSFSILSVINRINTTNSMRIGLFLIYVLSFSPVFAQSAHDFDSSHVDKLADLSYKSGKLTAYEQERCKLDLYLPKDKANFPVMVWLHGGGITINSKDTLESQVVGMRLASEGIGVAVINYRLSPQGQFPDYIEDVAAASSWVAQNIKKYQGNPEALYLGGHSAGGYLAAIAILDTSYLAAYDMHPDQIQGVIAISGQMDSHNTVKEERGQSAEEKLINPSAPLYHTATPAPPFLILYADDDIPGRGEINEEFAKAMRADGNTVTIKELKDKGHVTIVTEILEPEDATAREMVNFIRQSHHE
ncbi:alpha/beta hydrolase [Catalinimonas niigatensis]|uniref:alpha/beta hydrolase n=1 Tax=Catalinimonas niigatensis TaxID=1397264 RepID=UPI002666BA12|nr:alpha/beta hydrolase [Catalinimonas niigatensis]WPP48655.1 alpha/beta hydrolase [Catalinimonas niigatensis]